MNELTVQAVVDTALLLQSRGLPRSLCSKFVSWVFHKPKPGSLDTRTLAHAYEEFINHEYNNKNFVDTLYEEARNKR